MSPISACPEGHFIQRSGQMEHRLSPLYESYAETRLPVTASCFEHILPFYPSTRGWGVIEDVYTYTEPCNDDIFLKCLGFFMLPLEQTLLLLPNRRVSWYRLKGEVSLEMYIGSCNIPQS